MRKVFYCKTCLLCDSKPSNEALLRTDSRKHEECLNRFALPCTLLKSTVELLRLIISRL